MSCTICATQSTPFVRGLCRRCHQRCLKNGTIENYPRKFHKAADLIRLADELLGYGVTKSEAARRLGVTWDAVTLARRREERRNGSSVPGAREASEDR